MPLTRKTAFINLTTREVDVQEVPLVLRKNISAAGG